MIIIVFLYLSNYFKPNIISFNKLKLVEIFTSNESDNLKKEFNDIIPRIDINDINYIPTISELFTSRRLYINDKNITSEYISIIRAKTLINEYNNNNETVYEDIIINDIKDIINNNRTNKINWLDYYYISKNHTLNIVDYYNNRQN